MRNGLRVLAAVMVAGSFAACGGEDDLELYQAEETATPSAEAAATTQPADATVLMARFHAPDAAAEPGQQVSGTLRVLPAPRPGQRTGAEAAGSDRPDAATGQLPGGPAARGEPQGFRVEATLDGLPQGEHAWHIHSGPCGAQAPVIVAFSRTAEMDGLTRPLNVDQQGHAEGAATVPSDQLSLDELRGGGYSLHVHAQGGTDHGPTVACADLRGTGGAGA